MSHNAYIITCDNCGMEITLKKINKYESELKGVPVKVLSFTCPKCDEVYITSVFDKESDRMRDELKALEQKFSELRHVPSGESKDEQARLLLKEKDSLKRKMFAYNTRLKQKYLKELRRHGKR